MKKIGILFHPLNESACTLAKELGYILSENGFSVWLCSAWDEADAKKQSDGTELILSVGGDGTILRAAQVALSGRIPITGINMGKLGFMTELKADEAKTKIFELVNGDGWFDERAMLEVSLPGQDRTAYHALNDIVLARGSVVRIVSIETFIDGELFTTYRADGVILSTATGSTGYSLAAGGPILHPASGDFILLPILPHLSHAHSLVLPASTGIRLVIKTSFPATLSIDGHTNLTVPGDTGIDIKRSSYTTRFLRTHPQNSFYSTLEQKLKGKQTR
jgi:NAD+ kinase